MYVLLQEERSEPQSDIDDEQDQQEYATGKHSRDGEVPPRAAKWVQRAESGSKDADQEQQGNATGVSTRQRGSRAQKQKKQKQAPRLLVFKCRQPPERITQSDSKPSQQQREEEEKRGKSGQHQQQKEEETRGGSHEHQQQSRQQVWDKIQQYQQKEQQQQFWQGKAWQQSSIKHDQEFGGNTLSCRPYYTAPLPMHQQHSLPTEQPWQAQLTPNWGLVSRSLSEPVMMYGPGSGSLSSVMGGPTAAAAVGVVGASGCQLARISNDGSAVQSCSTAGGLLRFSSVDSESYSGSIFDAGASNVRHGSPREQQGGAPQMESPFVANIGSLPDGGMGLWKGVAGYCVAGPAAPLPVPSGEHQGMQNILQQGEVQQEFQTDKAGRWQQGIQVAGLEQQQQQQELPQVLPMGGLNELPHDELMQQVLREHVEDHHLWQQQQQQWQQLDGLQAGEEGAASGGLSAQQLGNGGAAAGGFSAQQLGNYGAAAGGFSAQQLGNYGAAAGDFSAQQLGTNGAAAGGFSAQQLGNNGAAAGGFSVQQRGNGGAASSSFSSQQLNSPVAATGPARQEQQLADGTPLVELSSFEMQLEGADDQEQEQLLPSTRLSLPAISFEDQALDAWLTDVLENQTALCCEEESELLY